MERSPDGSLSRLNNKRGVCLANSRSSTYIIPRDDVHRKRCQLLFPCIGLNAKGNIWLFFLAEVVKRTHSFLLLSAESSEAELGAVVTVYLVIGFKIRHNNTGPCGFKLQALQKGVIMQTNRLLRRSQAKTSQQSLPDASYQ